MFCKSGQWISPPGQSEAAGDGEPPKYNVYLADNHTVSNMIDYR